MFLICHNSDLVPNINVDVGIEIEAIKYYIADFFPLTKNLFVAKKV